jgi:NAD(P)-dependent dehydrogenase (short-subunit alcohol dehydrogenase family)
VTGPANASQRRRSNRSRNNATEVQGDVSNLADLDRLFAQIREEKGGGRVLTNAQPHTY